MTKTLRFLFIGDVVGQPGQVVVQHNLAKLVEEHSVTGVILNGENSASNGRGIGAKQIKFFKHLGVKVITTGNHIWGQRDSYQAIQENADTIIRPINFPHDCPGKGYTLFEVDGYTVAIVNAQGRTFMHQHLSCPFKAVESILLMLKQKTNLIFVDFHAEATSEKKCFGFFLDGKVSGVVGTHTHVPTADESILPHGTAYVTDLGYCGALHSSLGMKKEIVLQAMLTQMPQKFLVEKHGPYVLHGVVIEVDGATGKAIGIKRVKVIDENAHEHLAQDDKK